MNKGNLKERRKNMKGEEKLPSKKASDFSEIVGTNLRIRANFPSGTTKECGIQSKEK